MIHRHNIILAQFLPSNAMKHSIKLLITPCCIELSLIVHRVLIMKFTFTERKFPCRTGPWGLLLVRRTLVQTWFKVGGEPWNRKERTLTEFHINIDLGHLDMRTSFLDEEFQNPVIVLASSKGDRAPAPRFLAFRQNVFLLIALWVQYACASPHKLVESLRHTHWISSYTSRDEKGPDESRWFSLIC